MQKAAWYSGKVRAHAFMALSYAFDMVEENEADSNCSPGIALRDSLRLVNLACKKGHNDTACCRMTLFDDNITKRPGLRIT